MSDENGTFLLKDKDFVEWVDAEGNALPPVPKHWGADQLPAGATKKAKAPKASTSGSGSGSSGGTPPTKKDGEPAGNASTDEWVAFAKTQGATEDDLKDSDGEPLGQKALREKYGTPSA